MSDDDEDELGREAERILLPECLDGDPFEDVDGPLLSFRPRLNRCISATAHEYATDAPDVFNAQAWPCERADQRSGLHNGRIWSAQKRRTSEHYRAIFYSVLLNEMLRCCPPANSHKGTGAALLPAAGLFVNSETRKGPRHAEESDAQL